MAGFGTSTNGRFWGDHRGRIAKLGWILIVVGVLGEGVYEYAGWIAEGTLQEFNDILLSEAQKEAGDAKTSAEIAARAASEAITSAKDAGLEATNAQDIAKGARREAESFEKDIQAAKSKAAEAESNVVTAMGRAEEIRKQTDELSRQTSELATKLSTAEAAELAARKKEIELENSLAPRILGIQIGPGNKTSFDELKPFAGTNVIFEVLTDAEARRAAENIGSVLHAAGWNITDIVPNSELYDGFFDGVSIWYESPETPSRFPPSPEERDKIDAEEKCRDTARALEIYLMTKNWEAMARPLSSKHRIPSVEHAIPPNTLTIVVGFKPNPFFEPDWVKQVRERYKRAMEELKELEKSFPRIPSTPPK